MNEKTKVKIAPHSKESEMMVLGSMLTSVNALNVSCDHLDDLDFYFKEHQKIFASLKDAYKKDKPADIHLIAEELKRQERLDDVGGIPYLTTLAQYAGTSVYIEEYTELVKNKSILRRMIRAAEDIEREALADPKNVHESLDAAQTKLFAISQTANPNAGTEIKDLLSGAKSESQLPYLKELQQRQETYQERGDEDPGITGIPTHFIDVDQMINGLCPSHLLILACRPAMGKTALALNIVDSACFRSNIPTGIFSLEMTADELLHRLISSHSEVESDKIRKGSLSGIEYQRVVGSANFMSEKKLIIDDQPGLKITDLRARARRMKETHNIGLLIIDYLQLLSGSSAFSGSDNRQGEISEISRNLKNLARELNIPILCCAQLSRKVDERAGHRPMMSDLRESGSIEQDADIVMFLLRREYYDPYDKPGLAELIIGKNRHGAVGNINLTFRKEIGQFANYAAVNSAPEEENTAFDAFSPG